MPNYLICYNNDNTKMSTIQKIISKYIDIYKCIVFSDDHVNYSNLCDKYHKFNVNILKYFVNNHQLLQKIFFISDTPIENHEYFDTFFETNNYGIITIVTTKKIELIHDNILTKFKYIHITQDFDVSTFIELDTTILHRKLFNTTRNFITNSSGHIMLVKNNDYYNVCSGDDGKELFSESDIILEHLKYCVMENNIIDFIQIMNKYSEYDIDKKIFEFSCDNNKLDMIYFIYDYYKTYPAMETFNKACQNGYLDVVKFLSKNMYICHHENNFETSFRRACLGGNLDVVKYVLNRYSSINVYIKKDAGIRSACIFGYFDIVKFLYENYYEHVELKLGCVGKYFYKCIQWCCYNGNMNMMTFFMNKLKIIGYINGYLYRNVFINACKYDRVEFIKILFDQLSFCSFNNLPVNKHNDKILRLIMKAFIVASFKYNINIMEFLYPELENIDKIDGRRLCIYYKHEWIFFGIRKKEIIEQLFRKMCCDNKMEIAQFLKYNFDIDHHCENDYCFENTTSSEILEWLTHECPNPIFRIKSANY